MTSISDLYLLDLVIGLYAHSGSGPVDWDLLDPGADDRGVYWAMKRVGRVCVVVNRGSVNPLDFARDFDAFTIDVAGLGRVHRGFYLGLPEQWMIVREYIGADPWISTGHSLGAARSCQLTGMGMRDGRPPLAYVRFGEPRPGFQQLADLIAPVPGRSYLNGDSDGHDNITDVPGDDPPLFPYKHPQPFTNVSESPPPDDPWGPFRYHHAELYRAALAKLSVIPATELPP